MARHELVEKALAMLNPAVPPLERGSHEWWTAQWKDLARATDGLTPEDPRLNPVLDALAVCDRFYQAADLDAFTKAAERVRRLMRFTSGATVRWEGAANHRLTVFGPALIELVHLDRGRLWIFITWRGIERWVPEAIITTIEGPKS